MQGPVREAASVVDGAELEVVGTLEGRLLTDRSLNLQFYISNSFKSSETVGLFFLVSQVGRVRVEQAGRRLGHSSFSCGLCIV